MAETNDNISVADILGPWIEPSFDSGLIARCRGAWNKPARDLSREELATLLRQRWTGLSEYLLPIAKKRLDEVDDETEMYDGELQNAIEDATRGHGVDADDSGK